MWPRCRTRSLRCGRLVWSGSLWRWRFGPVGEPAQQAEDALACLVAAAQDHGEQDEGDGQRDDDVGCGQHFTDGGVQVCGQSLAAENASLAVTDRYLRNVAPAEVIAAMQRRQWAEQAAQVGKRAS